MATAQRRAREIANLRRAILDAARELFATEEYHAVSLRKIAEKIEYSPAAIYRYFSDKEEILFHLIDEGFAMLSERMHALDGMADPVERLRQGGRVYLEFALTQPHYYRLMFQLEKMEMMEKYMPQCESARSTFGFVLQGVAAAVASGQFKADRPTIVVASGIWATLHGAVSLALSGHLAGIYESLVHCNDPAVHALLRAGIPADEISPEELKQIFFNHMIEGSLRANLAIA